MGYSVETILFIFNSKAIYVKLFYAKCALFTAPLLLLIGIVNYFGDAAGLFFHNQEAQIAQYISAGYNVTNVTNIDERALQRQIVRLNRITPNTIVLGSSRILLLKSRAFKAASFRNHGVSGASIEDMIAIYQLYKLKGRLPQRVIIGIDPWIFNQNNGQTRWETLAAEYGTFLPDGHTKIQSLYYLHRYMQLFSASYFQSSAKLIKSRIFEKERTLLLPTKTDVNPTFTRLSDGSISYDIEYRSATTAEVYSRAEAYVSSDIYSLGKYSDFYKKNTDLLNMFIDEMLSQKIKVEFILIPYHPLVYSFLISKVNYRIIVKFEQYINELALNKIIPVTGSLNPARIGLDRSHFYDGMHLNEKGIEVVLQKRKAKHDIHTNSALPIKRK